MKKSKEVRILGVIIDNKFKLKSYTKNLGKKVSRKT